MENWPRPDLEQKAIIHAIATLQESGFEPTALRIAGICGHAGDAWWASYRVQLLKYAGLIVCARRNGQWSWSLTKSGLSMYEKLKVA